MSNLDDKRSHLREELSDKLIPSVVLYTRHERRLYRVKQSAIHSKKLQRLSAEQDRPLLNVSNTVVCFGLKCDLPKYVLDTLSLGPKSAILDKVNPKNILTELDLFLEFCKKNEVSDEIITDINVKTLAYVKRCQKQKEQRNIVMTKRYLKENNLLAIPYDKGIGICVMEKNVYQQKLDHIISLPQFEKVLPTRKNEKHPVLKEQERVVDILKTMKENGEIDDILFNSMKPRGSQPARLYGLAKVHKEGVPMRPVLSMPGSAYHRVALKVTEWLSVVEECKINSSTNSISQSLGSIQLDEHEVVVSFDVTSLYTNVPVREAIDVCSDYLFSGKYKLPPVSKATFKSLLEIAACDVLMLTHDGYYRQKDGLAMGSPPAPPLANGWLYTYDPRIRDDAKLYSRYMDDIIRTIHKNNIDRKLEEINSFHPSLKFTIEMEKDCEIPFLDMKVIRQNQKLSSTWYQKPTDTGLVMNFHSLAPLRYKRTVVSGFVHRIFRSCSSWQNFHESLCKAKKILENNQYPSSFYEPLITKALEKCYNRDKEDNDSEDNMNEEEKPKHMVRIQYRGKISDDYRGALRHLDAPCVVVFTLRKLKTTLPSLKVEVDKALKSRIVYKISCPRCASCYVGQTDRHLLVRFKEHIRPSQPVGKHLRLCDTSIEFENKDSVSILHQTYGSILHLMTQEALWIREIKPSINTKDEYKSRELTIRL